MRQPCPPSHGVFSVVSSARRFVAAAIAMLAFSFAGATQALAQCSDNWTGGGGDGAWSDKLNWSNGVPGSSDSACIQTGAAVTLDVGDDIAGLTLGSSDSLTLPSVTNASPSLNINGSILANSGQIILSPPVSFGAMSLTFSSSGTATLSGRGTITLNANSFGSDSIGGGAKLLNQSTIQGGGSFDMTFSNSSAGLINANETGFQLVVGRNNTQGPSTNTGLMEATNGGQLVMGSLTLNNVGGTIKASGKNSVVQLEGEGQGGETFTGGTWTTANGGAIQVVDSSALLDGTNGNTITNSGTMQLVDGAGHPGGNFQGTVNNSGAMQILSAGGQVVLNIPGGQTFTLTGTGSLTMGDGSANAYNNKPYISGATLTNQQLIQGTGGILNLTGFNNTGTINANVPTGSNNLQLQLGRAGASTNTGTIEASNGGGLLIGSTTINNTGGTIEAVGQNSYVALVGSLGTSGLTVSGGTFATSGGGVIYGQGFTTLDGTTSPVTNSGTLIVNDVNQNTSGINIQGTLKNTGTIQVLSTGDLVFLQLPGSENFTLAGNGMVTMGDGTDNGYNNEPTIGANFGSNGVFTNQSNIQGSGVISSVQGIVNQGTINGNVPVGNSGLLFNICCEGTAGISNGGTIQASNGALVRIAPFTGFSNSGTLIAAANSTIDVDNSRGPFLNLSNGTLTGGTYTVTGTLQVPGNITTNAASITLTSPASQILNPNTDALTGFVTNATTGIFILSGGRNFTSAGTFTNQGGIGILKGSTFTVGAGGSYLQSSGRTVVDGVLTVSNADRSSNSEPSTGSVQVKGQLFGNGGNIAANLYSAGVVLPANSISSTGKLTVTGSYTQTSKGTLAANLAGPNSGQLTQLNVTGTANLGGTLNIARLNNYVPLVGATFQILRAQHVNGTFATVNGTAINSSEHFTVTYNSTNVTLTVVAGP